MTTTVEQHDQRILTDGRQDPSRVGIQHDLDDLPDDFAEISRGSQKAIEGGFARSDLVDLIRDDIDSERCSKYGRFLKPELVELLINFKEDHAA